MDHLSPNSTSLRTSYTFLMNSLHIPTVSTAMVSPSPLALVLWSACAALIYSLTIHIVLPLISLYSHYQRASAVGLPIKLSPFPPGLFSFFAVQVITYLMPGSKIHGLLNLGRPDGYGMHKECGDMFLIVTPLGITLSVADPKVINWITSHRAEFPKPPNTGGESLSHLSVT